ncbi:MAG: DnaD domain protein [Lachnospiraceae bacterium]
MPYQLSLQAVPEVTVISNEFIDQYMAGANGEYVKVYLYLLRHQKELIEVGKIADALNHTEADVRRALTYWEKAGILSRGGDQAAEESAATKPGPSGEALPVQNGTGRSLQERKPVLADDLNRLSKDEDFAELLYIAQKYMNKVFTQRECQTFAYLYDGLHMKKDLLEYLVEYCAQLGHTSIRYLETVALNWHEQGIGTVDEAKTSSTAYTKDVFAVMRAFGIADRRPGVSEQKIMEKWFRDWGFTRELVIEACSRTLQSAHTPSFQYADRILSSWKEKNVRTMSDVKALDIRRREKAAKAENDTQAASRALEAGRGHKGSLPQGQVRKPQNQFHNFQQRDVDYDALILEQLQKR